MTREATVMMMAMVFGQSKTPGAISSDLYRHHFWEDILNFPFLFSFPMNLYCI